MVSTAQEHIASGTRAPIRCRILGSFISVLVAWLFLQIVALIFTHTRGVYRIWWVDPFYFAIGSFPFVFVVWLLVFMPAYVFIPPRVILWRWPVCTACGIAFGCSLWYLISLPNARDGENPMFVAFAAMTGGIACLFASLTMPRYHYTQPSNQSLEPTAGRRDAEV
jgi:hypothetical protein